MTTWSYRYNTEGKILEREGRELLLRQEPVVMLKTKRNRQIQTKILTVIPDNIFTLF